MSVKIDETYDFKFGTNDDQDAYTPLNGIYRVLDIYSYTRMLEEDVDIYELTFKKIGILKESFESEVVNYKHDNIYMLQSVVDDDIICIPDSIIIGYPSPDVKEYPKVMMSLDLGVFDSPESLVVLEQLIKDTIVEKLGKDIVNEDTVEPLDPKVSVVVYMKEWMNNSDYHTLRENRKKVIAKKYTGDSTVVDKSLYAKYIRVSKELEACKAALIKYYEKMSTTIEQGS